jgi:hypothetical protein
MKIRTLLICFFLLAVTLMTVSAWAQPPVTLKFSDAKVKGALETDSYAVNNAGVIAGDYVDSTGVQHGAFFKGSKVTTFDGPTGSTAIAAYGINSTNAVVGWYNDSNGVPTSFLYSNATFTPIAFPKATSTEANGINDNGWIVGLYFDSKGVQYGFYWDTKKYHKINITGAFATTAWAINNSNVITVFTTLSSGVPGDAYLLKGKTLTQVDVPGATGSALHGINNNGDLDYTMFDASNNRHGVLYQASTATFTQFDDPKGVNSTRADGINDTLMMVGRYQNSAGAQAGFKATTKP